MVFYSFKIFWAGSRLNYFESATHIGAWRHLKSRALSDTVAQQWRAQGGGAWGRRMREAQKGFQLGVEGLFRHCYSAMACAGGRRVRGPPPPMIPKIQILCAGHGHLPLIPRSRRMVAMTWASLGMAGASPGFFSTASDDIFANNFTFW